MSGFVSFFSRAKETKHASPSSSSSPNPPPLPRRAWPSCKQPKSLSFRADDLDGDGDDEAAVEAAVRRLRASERLFLEPRGSTTTGSIVRAADGVVAAGVPFEGAVAVAVESEDPRRDFRRSMEEMVAARRGAGEWAWLEEMLGWYLRANGKSAHGIIVGAFVELLLCNPLIAFSSRSCSCSSTTCSSSASFAYEIGEGEEEKRHAKSI